MKGLCLFMDNGKNTHGTEVDTDSAAIAGGPVNKYFH
jgi:hypothetical protein